MSRRRDRCLHVMSSMGHCFKRTYSICILLLCRNCPFKLSISSRFKRCIKINMFCSIMMHQRTAVHFSLTQRRNNTQSRGDLWVSSLMYSKVATKLKSREVANYVCIKRDYYEPVEEMLGFLPPKIFPHRPTSHMLPGPGLLAAKEGITETCSQAHFNEFPKQSAFPLAEFCRYISTSKG